LFFILLAKYRWQVLSILTLALVAIGLSAPYAYRSFKTWRGESLANSAVRALSQGDLEGSRESIEAAYQLVPQNALVRKQLARVLHAHGKSQSLEFWYRLAEDGLLNHDELIEYVNTALSLKIPQEAMRIMEIMIKDPNVRDEDFRMAMKVAYRLGDLNRIDEFYKMAIEHHPEDYKAGLILASTFLQTGDPFRHATAITVLDDLKKRKGEPSLSALKFLALSKHVSIEKRQDAIHQLLLSEDLLNNDYLDIQKMRIVISPNEKRKIIEEVLARFLKSDESQKIMLGRWLNQIHEYAMVLEMITEEQAKTNVELLGVYLDALAETQQWEVLIRILRDEANLPITHFVRQIYLFRSYKELASEEEALYHWNNTILQNSDVKSYYERLMKAGNYAEAMRYFNYAEIAYEKIKNNPLSAKQGYVALFRIARAEGKTARLGELLAEMKPSYPHEQALINDINYYNLLLGKDVEQSTASALQLYTQHPKLMAYRVTMALALLRNNEADKANALLNIPGIDWSSLQDVWKFVKVLVEVANGNQTVALMRELRNLLPEEKQLLDDYLKLNNAIIK